MNKLLACVCTGLLALSAFATDAPTTKPTPVPPQPVKTVNFDSLLKVHQSVWDSMMAANRKTMDSLMAAHQTTIQVCRFEADQAFKNLGDQVKAGQISPDSLKKIMDARRAEAQANIKIAIQDLKNFQDSLKVKIDKAREDLKTKIADKQKDVKGGIDVALARLEDAKKKLEAKLTTTTDKDAQAAIQEAIKRLNDIETHLKSVQAAPAPTK